MPKLMLTLLVTSLLSLPVLETTLGLSQRRKKRVLPATKTLVNIVRRKESQQRQRYYQGLKSRNPQMSIITQRKMKTTRRVGSLMMATLSGKRLSRATSWMML